MRDDDAETALAMAALICLPIAMLIFLLVWVFS